MTQKKLSFPLARRYDTELILNGEVKIEGIDLEITDSGRLPAPLFREMATTLPYDIAEQAFSHYLIAKDQGKPLTAIPAFPSRFFPQIGFTVNRHSGIDGPADLANKRIGVPSYAYNPAAWMRGILVQQYHMNLDGIAWVEEANDNFFPGLDHHWEKRAKIEKVNEQVIEVLRPEMTSSALESGRVDAVIAPGWGPALTANTRRLFGDPYKEIAAYVSQTGVFPINTVIILKEEAVAANPGLVPALMVAFREARRRYNERALAQDNGDHMGLQIGRLKELSVYPDSYGIEPNRAAIETIIGYCHDQGLIRRRFKVEELFAVTN
ncbi:MAG: ABC transporter substrate-binding protein [Candidatus Binataceae bacterium]|nr:ABC transporter substrate-binding protein [Candidatus Binataceae bacterium]